MTGWKWSDEMEERCANSPPGRGRRVGLVSQKQKVPFVGAPFFSCQAFPVCQASLHSRLTIACLRASCACDSLASALMTPSWETLRFLSPRFRHENGSKHGHPIALGVDVASRG